MDKETLKNRVQQFLQKINFSVLATTTDDGTPSTATVIFVYDDAYNFYIPMRTNSHKYNNCKERPHVSLAMYDEDELETIQLSGTAEVISDTKDIIDVIQEIEKKVISMDLSTWLPITQMKGGVVSVIKITPSWMRFASFSKAMTREESEAFFHDVIGKTHR